MYSWRKAKQPWAGRVTEVEWEIKIIIAHFTERKRNEKQDGVAPFFTLIESLFSLNHTQSVWDMLHIMNAYIHKQIHDLFSWKINTIALTLGCFALSPPLNMHDHKFFPMHFNALTDARSACASHFILHIHHCCPILHYCVRIKLMRILHLVTLLGPKRIYAKIIWQHRKKRDCTNILEKHPKANTCKSHAFGLLTTTSSCHNFRSFHIEPLHFMMTTFIIPSNLM